MWGENRRRIGAVKRWQPAGGESPIAALLVDANDTYTGESSMNEQRRSHGLTARIIALVLLLAAGTAVGAAPPQTAPDDVRVKVLTDRISRSGGRAEPAVSSAAAYQTTILLGETYAAAALLEGKRVPEKPEGYLVHGVRSGGKYWFILQGHDFHGLLWAITSFNQLVSSDKGRPQARLATAIGFLQPRATDKNRW